LANSALVNLENSVKSENPAKSLVGIEAFLSARHASEVTTLWRYTNLFIIIIVVINF